ncbi:hypothetical protein DDB_G0287875 [Dictyostelium discoideum AX4]|uniref:PH domain-containing protein DDB_G0287875 n=1 Tax=Dictyostelium discoideum TaxID=44689 RepID=Y7875_DICDI|nr:hypothetical protein DDB_G0287875 [Dictyostelium discoideum AX4]Q1ZXE2.1 RecName: Full=PH domain-containing protein DDB_G0287875 [Dictyostelium discoideum]EAS66845.1 hypothetical protein DDB_G0287875 [Dictyostelium discoideum AX4]|eukprot:XP_001134528.1 hypothetical protein DDB_G0287875 [Dictyostelium discoideum AX4]
MEPPQKKILKVFDQDGLYKTMVIEPSSTTGEICEKFAKKLFLEDSEVVQFSLFIFEGGVRHQLKNTDFPFDYLIKYEKKDYKFFFLNPNGEFISFDKDKQVKKSQSASTSGSAPPKKEPPKPQELQQKQHISKGKSGWLLRKRPGRYDKLYSVSKADKYLRLYENEDTDNDPLYELSLENSIIELKQDLHLQLTLGNSERYIFTHESESEIVSWAQELQATMNYTPGSSSSGSKTNIIKNSSPMGGMLMGGGGGGGGYIPSTKDLGVKLQSKAENTTTLVSTLIQWVNHILEGKGIKVEETEVLSAFSDGIVFINLIEDLFNQTISYRKGKSVYEMQSNIDKCLDVLKTKCGCDYGKILSSDVSECKVAKIIVRILWSMFVGYFCNCEGKEFNMRDKLISWCSTIVLQESSKQIIVESPSSLRNPMVFAVLVNKFAGSTTLDFNALQKIKSKQDQAQQIIEAAFNYLSIPMVVDSSFWNDDQLDEKSFLIYLSFYYIYLSGQEEEKSKFLQSCINPRPSVEPEQTISIRDKQLKLMREKKEEEDRLKKEKEEKEKEEKEKLEKESSAAAAATSSIASTANSNSTEPPKPTTVPLKKTISKLPPRKLPPTVSSPTTTTTTTVPTTVPTTVTTTTTTTSPTTSPTLTPKQPIGTTIKKPATAPLKLKPVAKPLPQPTPSSSTSTTTTPTTTPSSPKPTPVPRTPQLEKEKQDRLEKARLEKEKAEKEEQEFLKQQQEEEEEEQRLLLEQQKQQQEGQERLRKEEEEQQQQRELEEKQRQIDEEEAEEEARIRELEEEARKSKERLEKARLDKLAKAQKEREDKEREEKEKKEKEERERKERKHDENDMDTFKLLEDIVSSSSSPTITPPQSLHSSQIIRTTIEEDDQTNSELEMFQNEYNRLQDEEEHINSFLKLGSSGSNNSNNNNNNNNNKSGASSVTESVTTNKHKSIDILSDNSSVLSSLDDIINSIDKKTSATTSDSFNLSTSSTSLSFLPSSPDLSTNSTFTTNNNNDDETKARSLTSKARKPLPTLTKEQQSIIDKQTGLVSKQSTNNESNEQQQQQQQQQQLQQQQSSQNSTTSISTVNPSNLSINNEEKEKESEPHKPPPKNTQGRVVVRICLEGFGDVLFCSFAIGYDTLCGTVRDMVIKKMKVSSTEEFEYSLHIVRDGLERVLDDDEILLEAEDKIDRFVFKKNDIDRRLLISNHRPVSSK